MSRPVDPSEGDLGTSETDVDPSERNRTGGAEQREDEGGGEGGGGAKPGGDTQTASKGINPVQHSE